PERAEGDATIAGLLAEQERRDQVAAEDERELDAIAAVLAEGPGCGTSDRPSHHALRQPAVEEENHQERDEPQAVELGEVDALAGIDLYGRGGELVGYHGGLGSEGTGSPLRVGHGRDPRDQPVGQIVARLEGLGLRAGADQV